MQHVPIIQQDGSSSEQSSSSNRGINERTTNTGRGIMSRMSLRRGEKSKHRNSCANDQQGTTQKTLCKTTTLTKTKNWFLRSSFCLFLSGRLNRFYCIFSFWWIIPYHIDTVSMELTILYYKGLRSKISIQRCISVPEDCFFTWQTEQTLMKYRLMRHFAWVYTVRQSTLHPYETVPINCTYSCIKQYF